MTTVTQISYMVTSVLFILGVMRLRSPATARSGNLLAALGMAIALIAVVLTHHHFSLVLVLLVVIAGSVVGIISGRKVRMTAMPQMVALFNGMGGGAAAFVSIGEWVRSLSGDALSVTTASSALLSILIGSVSLTGSIVAFIKLQEWISGRPITYKGYKVLNSAIIVATIGLAIFLVIRGNTQSYVEFSVMVLSSLLLGVLLTLPIGGADMPVVISLLNAFTGLAAAATGFLLANNVLIIAGALVGASGTILTQQMSKAMNRPLKNILFGAFGQINANTSGGIGVVDGVVQTATLEDVATLLAYARRVVIVPGYGLAVARAQQEVRQLVDKLTPRGVDVLFGIHPVAGRMPGHMNVLLAEANVPYDRLYEMESINPEFPEIDLVLVIGANDVTNPDARNQPSSPLYGMPILNVDQARRIVVLKRSMSPGFAGIDNPLYVNPKTSMLFGDAKSSVVQLLRALDEV